ncbi:MAG: type II toxin-antitoxin system Phd/YefM family antitoxin [Pyrinomonadaceae bacterium]
MKTTERTIAASEFKAKCLKILDELDAAGIIVSKRGQPIARVIPLAPESNINLIGSMKGKIKVKGDLSSTGTKWNAES